MHSPDSSPERVSNACCDLSGADRRGASAPRDRRKPKTHMSRDSTTRCVGLRARCRVAPSVTCGSSAQSKSTLPGSTQLHSSSNACLKGPVCVSAAPEAVSLRCSVHSRSLQHCAGRQHQTDVHRGWRSRLQHCSCASTCGVHWGDEAAVMCRLGCNGAARVCPRVNASSHGQAARPQAHEQTCRLLSAASKADSTRFGQACDATIPAPRPRVRCQGATVRAQDGHVLCCANAPQLPHNGVHSPAGTHTQNVYTYLLLHALAWRAWPAETPMPRRLRPSCAGAALAAAALGHRHKCCAMCVPTQRIALQGCTASARLLTCNGSRRPQAAARRNTWAAQPVGPAQGSVFTSP